MTIGGGIKVRDEKLVVDVVVSQSEELGATAGNNHHHHHDNKDEVIEDEHVIEILTHLHPNVVLTPHTHNPDFTGAFIGVRSDHHGCRRLFPLGKLLGLRFMCVFRFKLWWMTQRMGSCGEDIPVETQFLIVEANNEQGSSLTNATNPKSHSIAPSPPCYVVFLPILEGDFRAVLQGNPQNELEICLESGCPQVQNFDGSRLVYVAAGSDPFHVITNAIKSVEGHLQTFCHRDRKKMPDMLNWFGWCTWDAFYTNVTADGVKQGLHSLGNGGTPPKFIIIDDGWQCVGMDPNGVACKEDDCANFANRLMHIKENHKFQKNGEAGSRREDGFRDFITEIKSDHALKYVYVWHAITGYWGGVKPGAREMEYYEPKLVYPKTSPGVQSNEHVEYPDNSLETMLKNGVGLVNSNKVFDFYNELHSYLASAGINGVKVDVQNVLETLGATHGGRLSLARKFHRALEASISRNFPDNGIISCMSHNTDALYSVKKAAVIRASDDFWPKDSASHTIHIASVAYNTIFLGEFMHPDWDMFHSLHPMAEYHGAARAIGGCAIYVSDKPGQHDFDLLRKLVLPDGSILRAKLPGRPTKDCLFSDPTRDGKSLLKIWNMNDCSGVIGVFNCQGAGWCKFGKRNLIHDQQPAAITGIVQALDVHYLSKIADAGWGGDVVMYSHIRGEVVYLPQNLCLPVTLNAKEYDIFTVVPVKELSNGASFAPVGLLKMFNSGGAVSGIECDSETNMVHLKVRGCGVFGAYSSIQPHNILVDSKEINFKYEASTGLLTLILMPPEKEMHLWNISINLHTMK